MLNSQKKASPREKLKKNFRRTDAIRKDEKPKYNKKRQK